MTGWSKDPVRPSKIPQSGLSASAGEDIVVSIAVVTKAVTAVDLNGKKLLSIELFAGVLFWSSSNVEDDKVGLRLEKQGDDGDTRREHSNL